MTDTAFRNFYLKFVMCKHCKMMHSTTSTRRFKQVFETFFVRHECFKDVLSTQFMITRQWCLLDVVLMLIYDNIRDLATIFKKTLIWIELNLTNFDAREILRNLIGCFSGLETSLVLTNQNRGLVYIWSAIRNFRNL